MAITFVQALQYSQTGVFQQQNLAAGLKTAFAVLDELDTVPSHTQRLKLAYAVIVDPQAWCIRLATACVGAAASFTGIPTDATIEAVVAGLWTKLALAYAASLVV